MSELGRINKPAAYDYINKRKIYFVPNIFLVQEPSFKELFENYWNQVAEQLVRLEIAGEIKKVFCEIIVQGEENPLNIIGSFNQNLKSLIESKLSKGATLISLEEKNIFFPYLDWSKCLSVISTQEVFNTLYPFYKEASAKRIEKIAEIIDKNLAEGEAGLLILKDEDRLALELPSDIEMFLVTPPAFDEINRWFRSRFSEEQNMA